MKTVLSILSACVLCLFTLNLQAQSTSSSCQPKDCVAKEAKCQPADGATAAKCTPKDCETAEACIAWCKKNCISPEQCAAKADAQKANATAVKFEIVPSFIKNASCQPAPSCQPQKTVKGKSTTTAAVKTEKKVESKKS